LNRRGAEGAEEGNKAFATKKLKKEQKESLFFVFFEPFCG
jgi:hypothetical protein